MDKSPNAQSARLTDSTEATRLDEWYLNSSSLEFYGNKSHVFFFLGTNSGKEE